MTPEHWQYAVDAAAAIGSIVMAVLYGLWHVDQLRKVRQ